MANYHVEMVRGDTLSFGLQFKGLNQDLESAVLTCKKNAIDTTYVFQKRLGDGISKLSNNKYAVRVAPRDTEFLEAGHYHFDLEIRVNGDVFTIMNGVLEIEQDVTY